MINKRKTFSQKHELVAKHQPMSTTTDAVTDAIRGAFGTRPWTHGEALKKAGTKNAFAHALSTPPNQIKSSDVKNLVNQLWEQGIVEIIPPKDRERTFKFRLVDQPAVTQPAIADRPEDDEAILLQTYEKLRTESQFRHVYLSDIFEKSGVPIEKIHAWASGKARKCEFELGQADWSLATKSQRDASININGTHYLTVGLLN